MTDTTYRQRAVTAIWIFVLLACWAGLAIWRSIADEHPAARVQPGTFAADLVSAAGPATVERAYVKRPGETDVCDGDAGVVKALEYMHPRSDSLRGIVARMVVEHSSLITVCVDTSGRVTSSHIVQF